MKGRVEMMREAKRRRESADGGTQRGGGGSNGRMEERRRRDIDGWRLGSWMAERWKERMYVQLDKSERERDVVHRHS